MQVGNGGMKLLEALWEPTATPHLTNLTAVEILRHVWISQHVVIEGEIRLRDAKEMAPTADHLESPYETEARYGTKGGMNWIGYKAHLTETCDDDLPHLLTQVHTTIATEADIAQLASIQEGLAEVEPLPAEHLVDGGYVRGRNLVSSEQEHGIDLVGPTYEDRQWQAKAKKGFDVTNFQVNWEQKTVACPQGRRSVRWREMETGRGKSMINVAFSPVDCTPCQVRALCTRAKDLPRALTLQPRAEHEAIQKARERQHTEEFTTRYSKRAGIEGTISQGVRAFGLRKASYRGLDKTHLQHVATATAINLGRLADWLAGVPSAGTRVSHFAALVPN